MQAVFQDSLPRPVFRHPVELSWTKPPLKANLSSYDAVTIAIVDYVGGGSSRHY